MDIPIALLEELVAEAEIYFFGKETTLGVPDSFIIVMNLKGDCRLRIRSTQHTILLQ